MPHLLLFACRAGGSALRADLAHWAERFGASKPERFRDHALLLLNFLTFTPEFRNLFYLRCGLFSRALAPFCRPLAYFDISCPDVGPGLFIQHGENTFLTAERIGRNCWIGRHVVVGFSNDQDCPTIGNDVRIYAGAKIIGKVTIGDHATIGLNTVITRDVPPGATMLGVPGRVVWIATPASPPETKPAASPNDDRAGSSQSANPM